MKEIEPVPCTRPENHQVHSPSSTICAIAIGSTLVNCNQQQQHTPEANNLTPSLSVDTSSPFKSNSGYGKLFAVGDSLGWIFLKIIYLWFFFLFQIGNLLHFIFLFGSIFKKGLLSIWTSDLHGNFSFLDSIDITSLNARTSLSEKENTGVVFK